MQLFYSNLVTRFRLYCFGSGRKADRLPPLLPLPGLLLMSLYVAGCTGKAPSSSLQGQIRGLEAPAEIAVETQHIHYKFSDPVRETQTTDANGVFEFEFNDLKEPAVFELQYNGESHPVYVVPGEEQYISFHREAFPDIGEITGNARAYYQAYQTYLDELEEAERHLRQERRKLNEGEENNVLNIQRLKIQIAKEYLADTPFSFRIDRHLGEFLTASLEHLNMLHSTGRLDLSEYAQRRDEVLDMARRNQFFSRASLEAQRAGIRDFSTVWVDTAPQQNDYSAGQQTQHEIAVKSAALIDTVYEGPQEQEINRKMKWELVAGIPDSAGQRHAVMYLIAEELGEGDFETGRQLLETHTAFLEPEPELLSFLETLRAEVARTQPGKPAIAFSIPDQNGDVVSLSDVEGRYVLIDFWASWCMPCINALPDLQALYEEYGREDLEIISISVEENEQLWRSALERFPQPWIQLYDGTGFDQETFVAYRAGSIPYYVLIDRQGNIMRNNDFKPGGELDAIIEEALETEFNAYAEQ